MTVLRRVLVATSIAWALLLPVAPFAATQQTAVRLWYALAFLVYGAGSVVCHQLPERSFVVGSAQWPVCARCCGMYVGAALAALFAIRAMTVATIRRPPSPRGGSGGARRADARVVPRLMLAVALLPTAATILYEWVTGDMPSNPIRAVAGVPIGAAVMLVAMKALATPELSRRDSPAPVGRNVH